MRVVWAGKEEQVVEWAKVLPATQPPPTAGARQFQQFSCISHQAAAGDSLAQPPLKMAMALPLKPHSVRKAVMRPPAAVVGQVLAVRPWFLTAKNGSTAAVQSGACEQGEAVLLPALHRMGQPDGRRQGRAPRKYKYFSCATSVCRKQPPA